ncbi:hypothetical protein, partial [Caproiciproducens sp.]|uniref:hypothetical protein n=1 Tax=Caproiciproducens sp. TaxID=1954376 RepID=UPI00289D527D
MRNRYYKHIGKNVGRAVRDAIRSGNFEGIGRAIDSSVQEISDVGNEVFNDLKNAGRRPPYTHAQNGSQGGAFRNDSDGWQPAPSETQSVYQKPTVRFAFRSRMPGSISGLVYAIVGASVGIPMLIADISVFMVGVTGYMTLSDLTIAVSVLIPITVAALGL